MKGIIIGGGIIGLSIARLFQKTGYDITVIEKDRVGKNASWVAGGMLAPQAEGLESGKFLEFCLESRDMYKEFVKEIEEETGINTDFWECGIFCPAFSENEKKELLERLEIYRNIGLTGEWLNRKDIEDMYRSLGKEILGGVYFPDDGQVDNRLLMMALEKFLRNSSAEIFENTEVVQIKEVSGRFRSVITSHGEIEGDFCIVAAGAWSGQILDIPVYPLKGEMAAIDIQEKEIDRVFFSSRAYIIPRKNFGRIVIGATEENVGFKDGNTVKGIMKLFKGLVDTFPHMINRNIQEIWFGYRPATPDLEPIIGEHHIENLYIATGHHRNGILLAPITAKIIFDLIDKNKKSEYLNIFSYKRFFMER
ncbi:glycine oxidase ThiO [Persephonella sp.]